MTSLIAMLGTPDYITCNKLEEEEWCLAYIQSGLTDLPLEKVPTY